MRRSRLAAARAGHVRKRGQPHGRQRNVGSPRGPHLMVSTSMVYGCIIDVFNTENISAGCSGEKPPSHPRIPCVYGLEVGVGGGRGCWGYMSRAYFWSVSPTTNYPWHTCAKVYWCYTCNCCFRAGWNSPLAVNWAVPKGCRGAGEDLRRADEPATRACVGSHAG